ncbi:MAG: thioesterase family protein [Acidobacteriota bacterium]
MRDLFHLWLPMDVRWADMDSFGHVNNAVYFTYCESARMAYFAAVDMDRAKAEESHGPALAQASCNFRRQVHHPAELEVGARVTRIGGKSFNLDYAIVRRGTEEVVCDGTSVVVWVDYAAGRAIPLPDTLRQSIRRFEGPGADLGEP